MRSVWFSRVVLGAAAVLLASIGLRYVIDPMGAVGPHGIVLGSAEAITIMRVTGSVFLGIALVLLSCLVTNRLLPGLALLATIATSITAVRFLGLAIDGPAPFTLFVLKPEVALVACSTIALVLERRRIVG